MRNNKSLWRSGVTPGRISRSLWNKRQGITKYTNRLCMEQLLRYLRHLQTLGRHLVLHIAIHEYVGILVAQTIVEFDQLLGRLDIVVHALEEPQ